MEELLKLVPLAPQNFYALLSMILLYFAIKLSIDQVKKYLKETKDTFDKHFVLITQMGKCLSELTTLTKIHDEKHEQHEEAIRDLRSDRHVVRYRDEKTG